jgi:hypothetical protein
MMHSNKKQLEKQKWKINNMINDFAWKVIVWIDKNRILIKINEIGGALLVNVGKYFYWELTVTKYTPLFG